MLARGPVRAGDLVGEAVAGVLQRAGRSALTVLGVTLGVGSFIVVLGITATANGQIASTFNAVSATQVTVTENAAGDATGSAAPGFRESSERALTRIDGVASAAVRTEYFANAPASRFAPGSVVEPVRARVIAVSGGYPAAAGLDLTAGRAFGDGYLARTRVALLGTSVATALGVTPDRLGSTIYLQGVAFTVVGTFDRATRDPDARTSVLVPLGAARAVFGPPQGVDPPQVLVHTRLGAAGIVAAQAPVALDPYHPERYDAAALAAPTRIRDRVADDLARLFVLLSGVCLVVGVFSIANTTLIGVLERTGEIGLRRALGARARDIGVQLLLETTVLGAVGGLAGSAVGVLAVVLTAVLQSWTAVIAPWTLLIGPVVGAGSGLMAGVYPSVRAARIEPVEALRR